MEWLKINGRKSYLGIMLWAIYEMATGEGWIDAEQVGWLEYPILALIGTGVLHKLQKLIDALLSQTPAVVPATLTEERIAPARPGLQQIFSNTGRFCDECGNPFWAKDEIFPGKEGQAVCRECRRADNVRIGEPKPTPAPPPMTVTGSGFDPGMN